MNRYYSRRIDNDLTAWKNSTERKPLLLRGARQVGKTSSCYAPQPLYCWHREKPGSNAEVDYVVQVGSEIYPIEVKSGVKGSMQSMRIFLQSKGLAKGIRTSMENFGAFDDVLIYPLYAIRNIMTMTGREE